MIPSTHARRPFTVFYFSSTAMELPSLCSAVRTFRENKEPLAIVARTQTQLSDQARQRAFVDQAMISADAVVIVLHGGKPSFPAWDALASALSKAGDGKRPYIHIHPQGSDEDAISAAQELSTDFGTPGRDMMKSYLSSGGHINIYRMIQALKILVLKTGEELPPAIPLPNEGIYHPDYDNIPDLEHYLKEKVDPSKPTAGLWFYQTYWVNNNLDFINAIIRKVEELGANVIPVFHQRYKDEEKGNKGADHIVNHYFMVGRKACQTKMLSVKPLSVFSVVLLELMAQVWPNWWNRKTGKHRNILATTTSVIHPTPMAREATGSRNPKFTDACWAAWMSL